MLPFTGNVCVMSPRTITMVEAFAVAHCRVTVVLWSGTKAGVAVKDRICTVPTLTVALPWIWPVALVAVRVKVVVAVGLTVAQSLALRLLPTPGVIEIDVAPVTCQHSLVELPGSIFCGVATKTTICGTVPVETVTVTGAVTDLPSELDAVKV